MSRNRILIVGGVAGGLACAVRARRLDEHAEIVLFKRTEYVASTESCASADEEKAKIPASLKLLSSRFNIEVRAGHKVEAIDRLNKEVTVKQLTNGETYHDHYTALVLAPFASPRPPALPGIDLPGVFVQRSIPDDRSIQQWIDVHRPKSAVIVGAGLIGLETAQELVRRGLKVTILERQGQVLPCLDPEMAEFVRVRLLECHVDVHLKEDVIAFGLSQDGALLVRTSCTKHFATDMAVVSTRLRPETVLAAKAGLELGPWGGVIVDSQMRTSDPCIWAVGDIAESSEWPDTESRVVASAALANRQGRIAADAICGRPTRFRGLQRTGVCKAFGLTLATTGATESALRSSGITDFKSIYLHPDNHPSYKPGASPMHIKLIFSVVDGKVLGAQAIGENGDERTIDVIAMAIHMGAKVFDLEDAELCRASRYPQYKSAKDPVNLAGMIAANVMRGDVPCAEWEDFVRSRDSFVIDVRQPFEFAAGRLDGARNIPVEQLRQRFHELPREREILVCCGAGQIAYYAVRILLQHGFNAKLLSGGLRTYNHLPEDLTEWAATAQSRSEVTR